MKKVAIVFVFIFLGLLLFSCNTLFDPAIESVTLSGPYLGHPSDGFGVEDVTLQEIQLNWVDYQMAGAPAIEYTITVTPEGARVEDLEVYQSLTSQFEVIITAPGKLTVKALGQGSYAFLLKETDSEYWANPIYINTQY